MIAGRLETTGPAHALMRGGRPRMRAGVALLLLLFCTCAVVAAILACSSLGARPDSSRQARVRVSNYGVVVGGREWLGRGRSWWRRGGGLWGEQAGLAHEELAQRAKAVAKKAMLQELAAQTRLKAVLARQERKHRLLVKELKADGWQTSLTEQVSRGSIVRDAQRLQQFLETAEYAAYRQQQRAQMRGRGILIAAGGAVPLANAWLALHMLRNVHGCTLPVEIYHNGPHELDASTRAAFEAEFADVRCVDIARVQLPPHLRRADSGHVLSRTQLGWVLKAQMLHATPLEQVLVLDADNLPLADPTFLFASEEFRASGNLFWPDFWSSNWHSPAPLYELLNVTEPWAARPDLLTTESGQFLLDRRRFDVVLEWVMLLNLHADVAYAILWGDKDTYRLAFTLAQQAAAFRQVEQRPANALYAPHMHVAGKEPEDVDKQEAAYTHAGMLQAAPSGVLLFLHRTAGSKLDPGFEYPPGFCPVDFVTPPLSPRQAANVHTRGAMSLAKFDTERLRGCAPERGLNLTAAAAACEGPHEVHNFVRPRLSESFPVPLFGCAQFAGLRELLDESMAAFRGLQRRFRQREVLLGTPRETW